MPSASIYYSTLLRLSLDDFRISKFIDVVKQRPVDKRRTSNETAQISVATLQPSMNHTEVRQLVCDVTTKNGA